MYILHMPELDDIDRRLIALLRADGRAPVTSLSRMLGVSRATVNSRLDRLTAEGTVLGFTIRVRADHDGDGIRAVSLIEVEGRTAADVIRQLRGTPEIHALHSTNGAWDLVAELHTSNLAEFDRLLGQIRAIDGVLNSETSLLLSSVLR